MTGQVFDIKRFALHDGPGIRTTAFLKGCPLRCKWCQNPEGLGTKKVLWYHHQRCIRCGACIAACPTGALSAQPGDDRYIRVDRASCNLSGACVEACPSTALEFDSRDYSAEELVAELARDQVFFESSGGGITLSGGEPLAQPGFAEKVLRLAKEKGLHTAIETTLHIETAVLDRFLPLVDLFLADIKHMDSAVHLANTGVPNEKILANIRYLAECKAHMILRLPLIPAITATDENVRAVAKFVAGLPGDYPLELINFNPLASGKYYALDLNYDFARVTAPLENAEVDRLKALARGEEVTVV